MSLLFKFLLLPTILSMTTARQVGIAVSGHGGANVYADGMLVGTPGGGPFVASLTTNLAVGDHLLAFGLNTQWCGIAIAFDGVYAFQMGPSPSRPWRATTALTDVGWNSLLTYNDSAWGTIGLLCSPVSTNAYQMYNGSPYYAYPYVHAAVSFHATRIT